MVNSSGQCTPARSDSNILKFQPDCTWWKLRRDMRSHLKKCHLLMPDAPPWGDSLYVNQNSDTNCCVSQYWCQNLETPTQWTVHFTLPQWSLINTFPPQSYVYVLYPMSAVAFCASIYMTLAVTVERWVEYIYLPNKNIFGQFVNINNKQVHVWQWPVNSRLCDLTWSLNIVYQ